VLRAKALWAAGLLAAWQGHGSYAIPRSYLEQSAALAREVADWQLLADVLYQLGNVLNFERDYAAAAAQFEGSLAAAREVGYTWGIANALGRLGSYHTGKGDTTLRRARREESLALRRQLGDQRGIAVSLVGLGEMMREEGDYAGARHCYEQALPVFRAVGSPINVAITLNNLGFVIHHLGDDVLAARFFKEALVLARDLNSEALTHLALSGLAGPVAVQGGTADETQAEGALRATRLLGAATALQEVTGDFLEPVDRADYDLNVETARTRLGEQAFDAEWARGRAMTMDEVIAYALELMPEPTEGFVDASTLVPTVRAIPTTSGAQPGLQHLTKRELEVLRLVAEGLTATQVAERLFLSVRTVENHLRSIYGKLDVSTRAGATRIAVENGLLND
jgi:DNA-binding CsgD family transcriptional regulator/tetratricopeptide (TPR) repeat protein